MAGMTSGNVPGASVKLPKEFENRTTKEGNLFDLGLNISHNARTSAKVPRSIADQELVSTTKFGHKCGGFRCAQTNSKHFGVRGNFDPCSQSTLAK